MLRKENTRLCSQGRVLTLAVGSEGVLKLKGTKALAKLGQEQGTLLTPEAVSVAGKRTGV